MESESSIAVMIKAIIYPFSKPSTFIRGCLTGLMCLILIGIPSLFGFVVYCGRRILKGEDSLPDWELPEDASSAGLKAFAVVLIYGIALLILTRLIAFIIKPVAGAVLLSLGTQDYSIVLLVSLAFSILQFIILLPVTMITEISLMIVIDTGDFNRAIDPRNSYRLLMRKPYEFLKAAILSYVAILIVSLPFVLFAWLTATFIDNLCLACLLLLAYLVFIGFMFYIVTSVRVFVWSKYYRKVTGGSIDSPGTSTATS